MTLRTYLSDHSIHTVIRLYVEGEGFVAEEQIKNLTTAYDGYEVIKTHPISEENSWFVRKSTGVKYRTLIEVTVKGY